MLTVSLLGTPTFVLNNQDISALISGRAAALLSYLAVLRQPQPRCYLAALLWENVPEHQARTNLRYRLSDLRKVIGDYIVARGDTLAFNHELPCWVDVNIFTNYMRSMEVTPISTAEASWIAAETLPKILKLYRGEFLAGIFVDEAPTFDHWVEAQRSHLLSFFVRGLNLRTQHLLNYGEYAEGLFVNHQLLTLEPWSEEAHRQRMLLLAHSGKQSAAMHQYERCCQILAEEFGSLPTPQTTTLYNAIKSGRWYDENSRQGHSLTTGTTDTGPSALQPTPVVITQVDTQVVDLGTMPTPVYCYGRQAELATLRSWIGQEHSRLVALLGISGQGKTTLAAAFVQDMIEDEQRLTSRFTSIIWRSLQNAPTCIEILQGWLHTLEASPKALLPTDFDELVTRLFITLQTKRCLLVLDNVDDLWQSGEQENVVPWKAAWPGGEAYAQLFRLFYQRQHRSCLLLTSRCRPSSLPLFEERNGAFHCLTLYGLSLADSTTLLKTYRIGSDSTIYQLLYGNYAGNPLLLKQAANLIQECFAGNVGAFVAQNMYFLGDIGIALAQQMSNLSSLEQQILSKLAQAEQPLTRQALWLTLCPLPSWHHYFEALQHLKRASLLEWGNELINVVVPLRAYLVEYKRTLAEKTRHDMERAQLIRQ